MNPMVSTNQKPTDTQKLKRKESLLKEIPDDSACSNTVKDGNMSIYSKNLETRVTFMRSVLDSSHMKKTETCPLIFNLEGRLT